MKECRVLPNVDAEGVRRPATEGLDAVVRPPARGEEGGAAGAQGVATEGVRENGMEPGEVPRAGGDGTAGVKPKEGAEAVAVVAAKQIGADDRERVERGRGQSGDDDDIALEEAVGFVGREVVRKGVGRTRHRRAEDALAGGTEGGVVVVDQFTEPVEGEEAAESKREEEEVVM